MATNLLRRKKCVEVIVVSWWWTKKTVCLTTTNPSNEMKQRRLHNQDADRTGEKLRQQYKNWRGQQFFLQTLDESLKRSMRHVFQTLPAVFVARSGCWSPVKTRERNLSDVALRRSDLPLCLSPSSLHLALLLLSLLFSRSLASAPYSPYAAHSVRACVYVTPCYYLYRFCM